MTPSVSEIRRRLRRPPAPRRVRLTQWYVRLVNVAIVGAIGWGVAFKGLQKTGQAGVSSWTSLWLSVLAAVVLLKVLLAFGPVFAGRDRAFWVLSSPVDRGAVLMPRFFGLLGVGAAVGAVWPAAVFGVVGAASVPGPWLFVGSAAAGVAVVAGAVVLQGAGVGRRGRLRVQAGSVAGAVDSQGAEVGRRGWLRTRAGAATDAVDSQGAGVGRRGWLRVWAVAGAVDSQGAGAGRRGRLRVRAGAATGAVDSQGAGAAADAVDSRSARAGRQLWVGVSLQGFLSVLAAAAVAALFLRPADFTLPNAAWLTPVAATIAVVLAVAAGLSLRRLNRAALSAGASLAAVARVSASWLDLTLLGTILAERRARQLGRVRSARLRGSPLTVLVWTDLLRVRRAPNALLVWAGLLPLPALVALGGEVDWVPAVHLIAAFLATDRLAAGLKAVCRSAAIRRAMGVPDRTLRLAHLVVPVTGAVVWCAITAPFTPHVEWLNAVVSAVGAVAVVYRIATRPPLDYGVAAIDFGVLGPVPLGLVMQLSRGPLLLYLLCVLQVMLG